jgi:hypothetical protein
MEAEDLPLVFLVSKAKQETEVMVGFTVFISLKGSQ